MGTLYLNPAAPHGSGWDLHRNSLVVYCQTVLTRANGALKGLVNCHYLFCFTIMRFWGIY